MVRRPKIGFFSSHILYFLHQHELKNNAKIFLSLIPLIKKNILDAQAQSSKYHLWFCIFDERLESNIDT